MPWYWARAVSAAAITRISDTRMVELRFNIDTWAAASAARTGSAAETGERISQVVRERGVTGCSSRIAAERDGELCARGSAADRVKSFTLQIAERVTGPAGTTVRRWRDR